jgi:hypothetical protein
MANTIHVVVFLNQTFTKMMLQNDANLYDHLSLTSWKSLSDVILTLFHSLFQKV